MLKGNDLILSLDGVRLAAAKSCGVERNVDTIEVCSPTDGPAKKFVPSTTSWAISAGGLYANKEGAERLRKIWRAYQDGVHTPLSVKVDTEPGVSEKGEAILTSLHEDGNLNELVKFSIQLQGSGKLEPWEGDPLPMTFEYGKQEAMWLNDAGVPYIETHAQEEMYSVSLAAPKRVVVNAGKETQVLIGDDQFAEVVYASDYQGLDRTNYECYKSREIVVLPARTHYVLLTWGDGKQKPTVKVFE